MAVDDDNILYKWSSQVEGMRTELQGIQSSLRYAHSTGYIDEIIQSYLGEMRSLSYRIDDFLETLAIEVDRRRGKGIWKTLRRMVINEGLTFHKVGLEIREIRSRIDGFAKECSQLKNTLEGLLSLENKDQQQLTQTSPVLLAKNFVGLQEEINDLVSVIVDKERSCQFISICGMGGTGKSALARKLYTDKIVRDHFEAFAWVNLGKSFKWQTILQDILRQLLSGKPEKEIIDMENVNFSQLYQVQQRRKCLVILDNIDSLDAWEFFRVAFQFGEKTSKVLMTTRMREVAEIGKGYIYTMRCLTEEEGWGLLESKVLSRIRAGFMDHSMMEEIGKRIVRRIGGLPLAIDMLGDFLATKYRLNQWDMLYHNMDSFLVAEESRVLASSFNDLPYHLKPCSFYLCYFKEESEIEVEKLYLLWMAEGIIASENSGKERIMMEIAEQHLRELQLRSLVEVEEEEVPILRRFKSCRLHGLMRQLCLLKGKEEEFFSVIDFGRESQGEPDIVNFYFGGCPVRRLIIYLDKLTNTYPVPFIRETAKYLRCLLISNAKENEQGSVLPQEISNLGLFTVLRILDFDGVDFRETKLPRGISKLERLRYLSFKGCFLEALPETVGNLSYLQVLDLQVRNEMTIPNILWKIERLRHLYLPQKFQTLNHDKLQLDSLRQLETLKNFNTMSCRTKDLLNLTNLRYLEANTGEIVEDLQGLINRMNMNTDHTLHSCLEIRNFDCYTDERHSVFRQLLGCRALRTFSIEGHIGEIPLDYKISEHLSEIVFYGSELEQDSMLAFEKLPKLRVLVLSNDAFLGKEMVCSASGFHELRRLELSNLHSLERLRIEEGALGKLSILIIQNCSKLERLADGLQFLAKAQMKIKNMPQAFEERLREIDGKEGEDMHKVKHLPPIIFEH